jgi:hypothetical protein
LRLSVFILLIILSNESAVFLNTVSTHSCEPYCSRGGGITRSEEPGVPKRIIDDTLVQTQVTQSECTLYKVYREEIELT